MSTETTDTTLAHDMFSRLDNHELYMIFHRFKTFQEKMNKHIVTKHIPEEIQTPVGIVIMLRPASDSDIDTFKNSVFLKTVNSIITKLTPYVELIEEAEPALVKSISEFK